MRKLLKEKFGLTDSGVKAVQRASLVSFFVNVGYMSLMMLAMYIGDNVLKGENKPLWYYLLITAALLVFVYFVVDREYVLTYNATYRESSALRLELADKLRQLPLSYFSRHDLSDLAQTIMQDVNDIEHAMSHAMPRVIAYIFFLLTMGVLLLLSNLKLGLAVLIPLALGFYLMFFSRNMQRKWTGKYFWRNREMSEAFQETFELQREMKNCAMEEENYRKVSALLEDSEKLRLQAEATQAGPLLCSIMVMKLALGLTALVSAALLQANEVQMIYTIGFLLASVRLIDTAGGMEELFAELFFLDARVKRLNELRSTATQQGREAELRRFDITLEHVGFSYLDEVSVVKDVSFVAKQNQVTAIVGPSGCGKSTLLKLISRLYDYQQGQILIDGHSIQEISTDALFDKVSFVFQDVILFNASVLDNIRIGREGASDEEVRQAARMANCEEFILKLPEGYESMIGENGSKLSGGERQRLSIARAFLKNAPILLLDEISSSLDVENETYIQQSLNLLTKDKTVLIVSHRLKSIEKVQQIVVMDAGRVEAVGTHEELLEKSALYRKLIEKSQLTEAFRY